MEAEEGMETVVAGVNGGEENGLSGEDLHMSGKETGHEVEDVENGGEKVSGVYANPSVGGGKRELGGATLEFKDVSVTVWLKRPSIFAKRPSKRILEGCSGIVKPGEILFIMGPSGAGKTTLLDALADRIGRIVPSGHKWLRLFNIFKDAGTEGTVTIDGQLARRKVLRYKSKYVEQNDMMYTSLTVKETLQFAANFYCSDRKERRARVQETLEVLGLSEQANVKIGGVFSRGISGGQRRRVSVGQQLIASPKVLFLDEPTSGLDSAACFKLVAHLRTITRELGLTVVATIHQPSTEVFLFSDRLMILSNGRTAYFGPSSDVEEYFNSLGYVRPGLKSIAEHVIDKVNSDFGEKEKVESILDAWPSTEQYERMQNELSDHERLPQYLDGVNSSHIETKAGRRRRRWGYPTGFLHQTWTLLVRLVLNILRNPLVLWMRVGMYCLLALFNGTVWLRIDRGSCNAFDVTGALFFILAFMVFMSISVLPSYIDERYLVMQERANGAYHVVPFNVAHTIMGFIMAAVLAIPAGTINYWLVGFNSDFGRYCFFILNLFLTLAVAESMMALIASIFPILIIAFAVAAVIIGMFMVVMGYFIDLPNIGWWWRWLHYVSLHSYAFGSFMVNEFTDTFWPSCDIIPPLTGDQVLRFYNYLGTNKWTNTAVLVGMIFIYRIANTIWQWTFHNARK
mmetsp:Transcript_16299/g.67553  ORF Transcript_16299/g.67553 Transcript_16299/m.67553 type:complete len:684 (-) Transcript_16299:1755-3806(-)